MNPTKLPIYHLLILILVMIGAGGLFFLTSKQLTDTNALQAEVDLLAINRAKLSEVEALLPLYSAVGTALARSLPANEEEVALFAAAIEQQASDARLSSSLELDDFPGPIVISGQNVTGLGVTITLEGSYTGLSSFMTSLPNLPYFYKIDKITVLKHEARPGIKATLVGALMTSLRK